MILLINSQKKKKKKKKKKKTQEAETMIIAPLIIRKVSSNFFVETGDRFNELESGFDDKSKRCQDMDDDHHSKQRNSTHVKIVSCQKEQVQMKLLLDALSLFGIYL